ncbi:alpha/beta fold hydrolase [Paracoccus onubensis]|uniref:alpha/beta fold hydrolase n=1 Tax=Paracoccus onubensis TaxID=1675788 RepID=UPI0027316FD6|nr:alpha/beta fold hydrolase [Paracoccus onubensis]MDP0926611.1 alpha/beta fold hydrolase [Paracoccus onubensis]
MDTTINETPHEGMAQTRDGAEIAWRIANPAGTTRIALIHSLAMNGAFWDRVIACLPADAAVLTIDCRGHGRSTKSEGPFTVEQFADDLADVMAHLSWQDAIVAGASMGGCVALAFATHHADRVSALGLLDTTAWYGEGAPEAWEERGMKAVNEGLAALVGFQKSRWFSPAFLESHPDIVDSAVAVFMANDVPSYLATCRMLGAADLREGMPQFDFPTLILVGEHDYATPPAMAQAMADAIPGATMEILPDMRHFTPLEAPEVIADALTGLGQRI